MAIAEKHLSLKKSTKAATKKRKAKSIRRKSQTITINCGKMDEYDVIHNVFEVCESMYRLDDFKLTVSDGMKALLKRKWPHMSFKKTMAR